MNFEQLIPNPEPEEDLDTIIAEMTEIIVQDPNAARAYFRRGNAHSNKGEYEETKRDMTRMIEMAPGNVMAHNTRGVAHHCARAIELGPTYRDAYHNRGLAYSELEELDMALADLDTAIELDPSHWSAFRHRGIIHQMKGNQDASYKDYLRARELEISG